ncbi:MAG: hypothetical protein A2428_12690 [Bdellovibrionales bacterium RIFOXYC1_FULL_54_43]|nr:MAG: hypothetical protein A2428_12690 [Bdellovibrionales bacterium RIFOXYC1_FULL_54_43]OFZ82399.1 MAG: hypothetical protein A2603_00030 [Bdellovibrionales bacterium RIFOXYD1_FULL_55_31]
MRRAFVISLVLANVVLPVRAGAMDRDVRSVLIAGGYGILGGTVLGIAAFPFTRDGRSIAVGTSIGLYLGIAAGFYYISHREELADSLRGERRDDVSLYSTFDPGMPSGPFQPEKPVVEVSVAMWSF